jgi:hypothetical protein
MRAIERRVKEISEGAEEVLNLELQRLDTMLLAVWPKAASGDSGAIDRVLKLMDRRARYLGLDTPQRLEHTGREGEPIRYEYDFSHFSDAELEQYYERARQRLQVLGAGESAES